MQIDTGFRCRSASDCSLFLAYHARPGLTLSGLAKDTTRTFCLSLQMIARRWPEVTDVSGQVFGIKADNWSDEFPRVALFRYENLHVAPLAQYDDDFCWREPRTFLQTLAAIVQVDGGSVVIDPWVLEKLGAR